MTTPAGFRELIREASPAWLRRKWGERYLYAFGLVLDEVFHWALEGVKARFPEKTPDEGLAYIGRDRVKTRGFAEPRASYVVRLLNWLESHRTRGNRFTLLDEIAAYLTGYAVRIRYVDDRGTWITRNPDGSFEVHRMQLNWNWDNRYPATARTRFWIVIYPLGTGLWSTEGTWGDGNSFWGDPGVWGSSATVDQVNSIRQLISDWKAAGSRCPFIIVAFDAASFDPTAAPGAPLPDGNWATYSKSVGGVRRPSRLKTARYMFGTSQSEAA